MLSSQYKKSTTKLVWQCCRNHKWPASPSVVRKGNWCPVCEGKLDDQIAKLQVEARYRGDRVLNRKWTEGPLNLKCRSKHTWQATGEDYLKGALCPHCRGSQGEQICQECLRKLGLKYEREKEIPEMPGRRYDFFFQTRGSRWLLEFDGQQHFEKTKFHTRREYEEAREVDVQKTLIPLSAGYGVIRIDYMQKLHVERHILAAIGGLPRLCLSTPSMYGWISARIS